VATAADGLGAAPLDVALAWVRDRPSVASAIVGARTAAQLHSALVGADLLLPPAIAAALDEVSTN
jgi:aryl-alcohol dehydrogenase-like predicted oxidoreductase